LDILVNNAGGEGGAGQNIGNPLTNIDEESWDGQIKNDLRTTFAATKAAIPYLEKREEAAIVNIASVAGLIANPALPAYAAAKAGVISLSESLALELASDNIRVNVICPGFLWTRGWQKMSAYIKANIPKYADMEPYEIFLTRIKKLVPLGREQTGEDIGKLAVFLSSSDAKNITGQTISVDGGILLKSG